MTDLSILAPEGTTLRIPDRPVRAIGIDLGTTNSAVAETIFDPRSGAFPKARCLEVAQYTTDGEYTHVLVPSVVAICGEREIVGEGAKRLRAKAVDAGLTQNTNLFYECKNDMGVRLSYHRAPEGHRTAAEIGGRVLAFIRKSVLQDDPTPMDRTVVTVPASFQVAQRQDTLAASQGAGLDVKAGDLLDEPVAAFIDYVVSHNGEPRVPVGEKKRLVVVDFGGGTCDVAVLLLSKGAGAGRQQIAPLSVSRYHRLGGGDIDLAILYEELIPQLAQQNGLDRFSLGYKEKKKFIEPALIGVAEALKEGLCREIAGRERFGKYADCDKEALVKKQPGRYLCRLPEGVELALTNPTLSAARFEELLLPFLDRDMLYARETEYRLTRSLFAPIGDAIDRSGLRSDQVDYCLLVGGSSLIPQVRHAIESYFPKAVLLTYDDPDELQTVVARGAAYHALSLSLYGRAILQPIAGDAIALLADSGPIELIPKGASLPYPNREGGYAALDALAVPKSSMTESVPLRLTVVAGEEGRELDTRIWHLPPPVKRGEGLRVEYRLDENQCLDLRIRMAEDAVTEWFEMTIQNPLTNVVNPQQGMTKILLREEEIRSGIVPPKDLPEAFVELAEQYADLRQHEKALEYLASVLRQKGNPDAGILNRMALICGELGDQERQEKLYREAAAASNWAGPWFNLALLQRERGRLPQALESVDKAIAGEDEPPYIVLRALILKAMGNRPDCDRDLAEALDSFDEPADLADWSLGWLVTAAREAGKKILEDEARAEQRRRSEKTGQKTDSVGVPPIVKPDLERRH